MKKLLCLAGLIATSALADDRLIINDRNYFSKPGLDVTVFSDIYPDGHQTGVTIIQHGVRVAANGDLRLEASPGQWSPVPAGGKLKVDKDLQTITQSMSYPDEEKNRKGFNPIEYPDLEFSYDVRVQALEGNRFSIKVDLHEPLPDEWIGRVGFNLELFPGHLFGKGWIMDKESGFFPVQANGPINKHHGEWLNAPLARGKKLVVAPAEPSQRLLIEAVKGEFELLDGRSNHNNGWFIVRSLVPGGATQSAIEWVVTANTMEGWVRDPVIQVSQLGYTTKQPKKVIIEQDDSDTVGDEVTLYRLGENGKSKVAGGKAEPWGEFLRYRYFTWDFGMVETPGLYVAEYRGQASHTFRIGDDVFSRHAWQPTLEYYLPVQMCHMRVNEKYRVWHGLCHHDDALMSPINTNHFDGYISGPDTLTKFEPLEHVPGLNKGGWHDAGDYDLRVESQMTTVWLLSLMVEEFGIKHDATLVDQEKQLVEIHHPDGKDDVLQQIEHGLLSVLGAYQSMGRLYRGIIVPTLRQYILLGDGSTQTDNLVHDKTSANSPADDRWVFTEENPSRELNAAAGLAAASRVLREYNSELSKSALDAAKEIYQQAGKTADIQSRAFVLSELYLATGDSGWLEKLVLTEADLVANIEKTGWAIGRVVPQIENELFQKNIGDAVAAYQQKIRSSSTQTPYGVPYKPHIWGAGWGIQRFGVSQYLFHQAWPELTDFNIVLDALNFVLGVHPGENTMSFVSGVGAKSALVAYGVNRADWSFIPGGVISGTALIRPDLPELKTWPFFWQQTEYVMGGGATNYMFLALAADAYARQQVGK